MKDGTITDLWFKLLANQTYFANEILHYFHTNKKAKRNTMVICPVCREYFTKKTGNQGVCSSECRNRINAIRTLFETQV